MATINWQELAENYSNSYATPGTYKTKVADVVVGDKTPERTNPDGSISGGSCAVDITFTKVEGKTLPKARYYLSFKEGAKVGFRQFQHMCIMRELAHSAEKAQQAIENIEGKDGEAAIIKAYKDTYSKLGDLGHEVTVEVYEQEGNDGRKFTHSQLVGDGPLRTQSSQPAKKVEQNPLADAEPINLDEILF